MAERKEAGTLVQFFEEVPCSFFKDVSLNLVVHQDSLYDEGVLILPRNAAPSRLCHGAVMPKRKLRVKAEMMARFLKAI